MELSSYRIFEAVASLGSMAKAADALYLTPSAVSHAVLKLEKEFGFPLFIRDKKKTVLTAYGQEILPKVRALLLVHNNLDEEISMLRGTTRGTVHVGTFNSTCCFWLTKILPLFREKYPHIEVVVREGGYADCEDWLITQQIDLAFVRPPVAPTLKYETLYKDPMRCITPRSYHPQSEAVTIEELRQMDLILSDDGYLYDVQRFFSPDDPRLSSRHSITDDSSILSLVAVGMGCSILPQMIIDSIPAYVNAYPIENSPYRTIGIATQHEQFTTPAAKLLFDEIVSFIKSPQE